MLDHRPVHFPEADAVAAQAEGLGGVADDVVAAQGDALGALDDGLGAGLGFVYWHQQGGLPFFGGRSNADFNRELSRRTGIQIGEHETTSHKKAQSELLRLLSDDQPVCVYADMAYLSYLGLPEDAHFGGHLIVVAGYDATTGQALIADLDPRMTGVKTGHFYILPLEQLALARASKHQPFPPKNHWFTFDFTRVHRPDCAAVYAAIDQTAEIMLKPPIKNFLKRTSFKSRFEPPWAKVSGFWGLKMAS